MLEIKADFKVGDVVSFKLLSGEEWISKIQEITEDSFIFKKPMGVQLTPQGLAFVPAIMTGGEIESVTILKSNIMAMCKSEAQANSQYIKATTGLEVTSTGGLQL